MAGLQLPAGAAAPESYVAMGDSFTAGPGILLQRLEGMAAALQRAMAAT